MSKQKKYYAVSIFWRSASFPREFHCFPSGFFGLRRLLRLLKRLDFYNVLEISCEPRPPFSLDLPAEPEDHSSE